MVSNFCGGDVQLDGVIGLDDWIWITDGTTIVCYQEWNVFSAQLYFFDFAQLVLKNKNVVKNTFQLCYCLYMCTKNINKKSLTLASSPEIRWMVKRPLTS